MSRTDVDLAQHRYRLSFTPTWAIVFVASAALAGCHGYAYHDRGPAPDFNMVAIDKEPHQSVRWSYLWGLYTDEWTPRQCVKPDAAGACAQWVRLCGSGVGRFETSLLPYSVPVLLATLGIAMPAKVAVYCSTDSAPGGPVGGGAPR